MSSIRPRSGGSFARPDSRPLKHWPRGRFAACWKAAGIGDLQARSHLLEHLREPAIRIAQRFARRHPQADPGELAGLLDVALIEVVDRELKRSELDFHALKWILHSRLTRAFERSLIQEPPAPRGGTPPDIDTVEISARHLVDALGVRRHEVASFDLDRWDAALHRLQPRERKILLAR